MLIEHRAYTPRPGQLDAFLAAQVERGFAPIQPVLDRLIGYFIVLGGPVDQIVHLYRFDSYDDWVQRLHGLYGRPELQSYFVKVRPMMLAQENKFLLPAPLEALTPVWGNGNDWLPGQPIPSHAALSREAIVEEVTTTMMPGGAPVFWDAFREEALRAGGLATAHGFACFSSIVGRLHQIVQYRVFPDYATCEAHAHALRANAHWRAMQQRIAPVTASVERKLMTPAPRAEMSPLVIG